jgi:lycopene beta-cyclase
MSHLGFLIRIRRIDFPILFVIIFWLITLIATPIARWALGDVALQRMIAIGVLGQAAAVIVILVRTPSWKKSLLIIFVILPVAWAAEFIGSHTGIPFGSYSYTDVLQPQIGRVPLLIPLAWLMMLPPSWAVASLIVNNSPRYSSHSHRVVRALIAALAFTAWDLYLDPQMVLWNFWQWGKPGIYFGIPLVNFVGWIVVAFLISIIFLPNDLPIMPLLIIYIITWLFQFIGQLFFWKLFGPALFGFLAMGAVILMAFWRHKRLENDIVRD